MVMNQPITMFLATPQRTARVPFVEPTPMIAEVMTCVVEIGAWNMNDAVYMTEAAVVSAAKPCGGSSSMMRRPSVRMIRQPPAYVPSDSVIAQASLTHSGIASSLPCTSPMTRAITTMPMVFCASCRPWPSAMPAADTVWAMRKPRLALCGLARRNIHMIATITR